MQLKLCQIGSVSILMVTMQFIIPLRTWCHAATLVVLAVMEDFQAWLGATGSKAVLSVVATMAPNRYKFITVILI